METQQTSQSNLFSSGELKQVKVDNWGTFFLQRLQQLYSEEQFLDLKIVFPTNDIIIEAHRLVLLAFTEYFLQLEQQQKESDNCNGIIIMPSNMPYECVKPIIRFMYTGQLEYWSSEQDDLYCTARKMDMTVLTKLLDLELTNNSMTDIEKPCSTQHTIDVQEPSTFTKSTVSSINSPLSLSKQLLEEQSDRSFPIWKKKLDASSMNSEARPVSTSIHKSEATTPGPSRFNLPEADNSALEVFSFFDDPTYNMKSFHQVYKNESYTRKRPLDEGSKNDTIKDVKRGKKSEKNLTGKNVDNVVSNRSISRNVQQSQDKQLEKACLWSPEEKENIKKPKLDLKSSNEDSVNNHANIVKEVLKKYPHLVKNNSNIRVRIMQKKAKSSDNSKTCNTKTSYVVFKSEYLLHNNNNSSSSNSSSNGNNNENNSRHNDNIDNIYDEKGPWKCNICMFDKEYTNYDMYKKHMKDVHGKKYFWRTCEYCDYKAKQQNHLIYHLYIKHNVPLPPNQKFYKCHVCSYVALTETHLLSHIMKYNHQLIVQSRAPTSEKIEYNVCNELLRNEPLTHKAHTMKDDHQPTAQHHTPSSEKIPHSKYNESLRNELSTQKPNNGHRNATDEKRIKFHRCKYCGEMFRHLFNLHIHLDSLHKELLRDKAEPIVFTSLTPPNESPATEALSYVSRTSLPAESRKNAHEMQHTLVVRDTHDTYILPDIFMDKELDITPHNVKYNAEDQSIILTVSSDGQIENYQQQPDNTQVIMQDTESIISDNVVVYSAKEADHRFYENQLAQVMPNFEEEVVEEVVEEVEEFMEEEKIVTKILESSTSENCVDNRIQEVIQYIEEQTEIMGCTSETQQQCLKQNTNMDLGQESVIILKNMKKKL